MSNDDNPRPVTGDGRFDDDATAELLAQALHDEASTVQTDPNALQTIQQRTAGRSSRPVASRRSWLYAGLGAAAATAAVIAGVMVATDRSPDAGAPAATGGDDATSEQADSPQQPTPIVNVRYVGPAGSDWRLQKEFRSVAPVDGASAAWLSVHTFLTEPPKDADYVSGWPDGVDVTDIDRSNGTVTVHLEGPAGALDEDSSLPDDARANVLQALFRNAGGKPGNTATLTYNGDPVLTALGVELPVTVVSDDQTRALISFVRLLNGQPVENPVTLTVEGNVFEGNVMWTLTDASGTKVDDGFVTTSMGSWSEAKIRLGRLDPGTYTIRAFEQSPENGKVLNLDDKTFTVE
jgi:hypothetical protein